MACAQYMYRYCFEDISILATRTCSRKKKIPIKNLNTIFTGPSNVISRSYNYHNAIQLSSETFLRIFNNYRNNYRHLKQTGYILKMISGLTILPHILIMKMYDQDEVFHSYKEKEMLQEIFLLPFSWAPKVHLPRTLFGHSTLPAHLFQCFEGIPL